MSPSVQAPVTAVCAPGALRHALGSGRHGESAAGGGLAAGSRVA